MISALEKSLANKIGSENSNGVLLSAMKSLLILLLTDAPEEPKSEDDLLMEGMKDRITGRRKFSSLANELIAKPS